MSDPQEVTETSQEEFHSENSADEALSEPQDEIIESEESGDELGLVGFNPRLIVKRQGVETAEVFPFTAPAIVGRFDPSVGPIDIDLGGIDEGGYVSRKHAKITETDGVYTIHDLGSSNGVYLLKDDEFVRVTEEALADGQELAFGNARFVFRLS